MDRLEQLNKKRMALRLCLFGLSHCKDDPRYPDAKDHYQKQLDEVDEELTEILGYIPPVIVNLKTASLSAESSKLGE